MNNWETKPIGKAISFNPPESIKKGSRAKKISMRQLTEFQRKINGFEFSEYNSGPKFRNGDTLVAKITPCIENGKTAYVDMLENQEIAFGSSEFIVLRKTQHTIEEFIYYLAISPTFRNRAISCMEGTSGRQRVNEKTLRNFELPFPSIYKQTQIAKVLSDLDTKIELNNKINTELEAMAKLIYDYWFVQFDFPDENGKPYKSSGGKMVFNEELKREIPEGWEVVPIKHYANIIDPHPSHRAPIEVENGFPFAGIGDIDSEGNIAVNKARVINEDFVAKQERDYDIGAYSIGYGRVGTVGKVVKLRKQKYRYALSPTMAVINPISEKNAGFIYFSVNQPFFYKMVLKNTAGTTRPAIGIQLLREIPVLQPSIIHESVLTNFEKRAIGVLKEAEILNKQNQNLIELRDWLLPMLMNGQVKVASSEESLRMVAKPKINYNKPDTNYEKRNAIAACVILNSEFEEGFGKVKFEKLLHLSEYHIVKDNYSKKYYKDVAGPLDSEFTYPFLKKAKKEGIISIQEMGKLHRIKAKDKQKLRAVVENHLDQDEQIKIEALVKLFLGSNYEKPEIVSTLYAVWNNRIIKNELVNDELIKIDFLDWSKEKIKYKDKLDRELNWMRKNGIVPDGWGKVIEKVNKKTKV